jgi:hypothetical protein
MSEREVFEYGYRNGRQLNHFLVDVTSAGFDHLLSVMQVAFSSTSTAKDDGRSVETHVLIEGSRQLTFFRAFGEMRPPPISDGRFEQIIVLPAPIHAKEGADIVWDWLTHAEYGGDEHDGFAYKGWRVFNQQFGIVDGDWDAFIAVRPMWIYLPK